MPAQSDVHLNKSPKYPFFSLSLPLFVYAVSPLLYFNLFVSLLTYPCHYFEIYDSELSYEGSEYVFSGASISSLSSFSISIFRPSVSAWFFHFWPITRVSCLPITIFLLFSSLASFPFTLSCSRVSYLSIWYCFPPLLSISFSFSFSNFHFQILPIGLSDIDSIRLVGKRSIRPHSHWFLVLHSGWFVSTLSPF